MSRTRLSTTRWSAVLVGSLTVAGPGRARAQDKPIELKLSSSFGIEHPHHKNVLVPWAKMVETRSGGRLKVTIHPGGVLGKAADHWDMVKDGVVDIGYGAQNHIAPRFPLTSGLSLPFIFNSAKGGSRAVWELYQMELKQEHQGVKVLWLWVHGPGQLQMTKKPVRTLEDLAGLKIRVPGGQVAALIRNLGAVPVTIPAMETHAALTDGTVDGTVFGWDAVVGFQLSQVVRHHTVVNLYSSPFYFVMNQGRYDGLPPDLKKVIDDLSGAWGAEFTGAGWAKGDEEGMAAAKKAGAAIYTLSPAERQRWMQKAKEVENAWLASTESRGLPGRRVLTSLRKLVEEYDP